MTFNYFGDDQGAQGKTQTWPELEGGAAPSAPLVLTAMRTQAIDVI